MHHKAPQRPAPARHLLYPPQMDQLTVNQGHKEWMKSNLFGSGLTTIYVHQSPTLNAVACVLAVSMHSRLDVTGTSKAIPGNPSLLPVHGEWFHVKDNHRGLSDNLTSKLRSSLNLTFFPTGLLDTCYLRCFQQPVPNR